jgi:FkbM family methyltransferase
MLWRWKFALRPKTRCLEAWSRLKGLLAYPRALGWLGTLRFAAWQLTGWRGHADYVLHPRTALHSIRLRPRSSDHDAFYQVFIFGEYACLEENAEVDLIIDCGANIGCSSAYFLSRYPYSRVIAVEPDPENCAQLRRNLAAYGARATVVEAGIWPQPAKLVASEVAYRDGSAWTRQVREARTGETGGIQGVDVATLLADSGAERISILKMDIEGTEALVFAGSHEAWLDKTDVLLAELHDDSYFGSASAVFFPAMDRHHFTICRSGELRVCRRQAL